MTPRSNADAGIGHPKDELAAAPYTDGYVETDGLQLHFQDYGTSGLPPMLCIHGGAANGHWFDFVAPGLRADYHVRALDLRGHGDSEWIDPPAYSYERYAADIAEAVEKLDLRDFVLIGHSMGGMVSLVHAATYPGRVKRLVIVDTTMHLSPERIAAMRDAGNREGSSFATQEQLVARYRLRPGNSMAPLAVQQHIARSSSRQFSDGTWRYKFDRNVYATREAQDGLAYWEKIRIPSLLVKGGNSQRITPEIVADVQKRAPQVELAEVPNADHHVTLDNPTGFVQVVKEFLAKHP
jgi:pimeloyl-ACP methyl ester carboxylesterase